MIKFKRDKGVFSFSDTDSITIGTAGKGVNGINYCDNDEKIRFDEKLLLERITGILPGNIIMLNQVHGDSIINIERPPEKNLPWAAEADGLITGIPGVCLVIRTADCVPVFVYDSKKRILGAVHSGWKGCRLSITLKLVKMMREIYSSNIIDMDVFILPAIGPDSYIVQQDVASYFKGFILERKGELYLDLPGTIKSSLMAEGIPEKNIHDTVFCTVKNNGDFFSYRKKDTGRNLNFGFII